MTERLNAGRGDSDPKRKAILAASGPDAASAPLAHQQGCRQTRACAASSSNRPRLGVKPILVALQQLAKCEVGTNRVLCLKFART